MLTTAEARSSSASPGPLSIFTGTKAQFIKMAPLVLEFQRRGWPCRLVDTGQHAQLIHRLVETFGLRPPDISLSAPSRGVVTLGGGLRWMLGSSVFLSRRPSRLCREIFGGERGLALVHGDTASTLISTLVAKRAGQRVAHVEAGLRSHRWLHPFPEELIRVLVMRRADLLFAPSPAAYRNLEKMGLAHRAFLLPGNTNRDALAWILGRPPQDLPELPQVFSLASFHRLETLYRWRRLARVVEILLDAHRRVPLVLVQHPPTRRRLEAGGWLPRLIEAGVTLLPLLDYPSFIHLLARARFVVTDGGSVQEETSYLGIPCLLLRQVTERDEGLGENVVLSNLDPGEARRFLDSYENRRRPDATAAEPSPSSVLADRIAELAGGGA